MTKLEEKLIELGYKIEKVEYMHSEPLFVTYEKQFKFCHIEAWKSLVRNVFHLKVVYDIKSFAREEVLNELQQAFNVMEKDLEVLKKYGK